LYVEGVAAKKTVAEARTQVARALEAHTEEIVFTSGGTEANNLAIFGVIGEWQKLLSGHAEANLASATARARGIFQQKNIRVSGSVSRKRFLPHLVTTNIEHSSVLEPLRALEKRGLAEVSFVPVERNGIVRAEKIIAALRPNTVLVSVQYVNNEIGTIQPIAKIGKLLRACPHRPLFHTDACQAPLYLNCLVNALGVDLLTLDAHKMYGPKGVGVLYVRRGTPLAPLLYGGGQERGLRATTENMPGMVGCAAALSLAFALREKESVRLAQLRDLLYSNILQNVEMKIVVNGSMEKKERVPNNLNLSLLGIDTEMLMLQLDAAGVAVSTKSSCLVGERESFVVRALGGGTSRARSTFRFTLGRFTTKKDIEYAAHTLARLLDVG
jgi:cysteine desulfurase